MFVFSRDCFYAQVEMLERPELREKPVGVTQKYLVVTCNYPARARGVKKLMAITAARAVCPGDRPREKHTSGSASPHECVCAWSELILFNGEDLGRYRVASMRLFNLVHQYSPLTERMGLDEVFLDVTAQVAALEPLADSRLPASPRFIGHVVGDGGDACRCGCMKRLQLGSMLLSEIRRAIFDELGCVYVCVVLACGHLPDSLPCFAL